MQTVNNYDLEWTRADDDDNVEYGTGVFNGDLGIVDQVTSNGVNVLFDDGRYCEYDESVIDSLSLAYAISVHKSQGCEFDAVVMVCFGGMPMIMTRNLLYTAITRAKKWVLLIGNPASVARMVHNNFTETRYSKLKSLILDGIIGGVGAVLGFVPQMLVLFLMLGVRAFFGKIAAIGADLLFPDTKCICCGRELKEGRL